jgi:hypothetical protein
LWVELNERGKTTFTLHRLDPTLPKSGFFQARWRLQLNIGIDELARFRTQDSAAQHLASRQPAVQWVGLISVSKLTLGNAYRGM